MDLLMMLSWREAVASDTVLVLALLNFLSVSDANVVGQCGPDERWLDNRCQPCLECDGGMGLDQYCGFGDGTTAICQICSDRETYSQLQPSSYTRVCDNCTSCVGSFHRETTHECTIYQDTKCGSCLDGWFGEDPPERDQIMTPSCRPCNESAKGEQPQCNAYWGGVEKSEEERQKKEEQEMHIIITCSTLAVIVVIAILVIIYVFRVKITSAYKTWRRPLSEPQETPEVSVAQPETPLSGNTPQQATPEVAQSTERY